MRVIVSGKTYNACLDPGSTEFFRDHPGVPEPELIKRGFGYRADFGELDGFSLWFLLDHLYGYADVFLGGGSDAKTAAEGGAILADWERLAKLCEPTAPGYYRDDFGAGWYYDGQGWHYAQRLTDPGAGKKGTPVPAGQDTMRRSWLHVAKYLPLKFVAAGHPDDTWRRVR